MNLAVAIGGSLDRDVRDLPPAPLLRLPEFGSKDSVRALLSWFVPRPEEHLLLCLDPEVEIRPGGIERLRRALGERDAALAYSDYLEGSGELHPLIDYQPGSLRDDFDFGALLLIDGARLRRVFPLIEREAPETRFAGWYETRLRLSELGPLVRVGEPLYRFLRGDDRPSGQKVFDYLDPRRRAAQREMEEACTRHLRRIGAWRPPPREPPLPDDRAFPVEASVVIPVKNRARTIADAVKSALSQKTAFAFNVIVVDNHSEDGTGRILEDLARQDGRLVRIVPQRHDLGIGGCWNLAAASPACGRYAVQLDSDDLYNGDSVLERLVGEFSRAPYAMVIGSYTTVDFSLQPVPPGLVDHREWTEENGHNNALRVGGLGAPRAFHTPTLRSIGFPDASYAEDYAVGLRMCRRFRIGRIFESLYWCRRWEDNTDARLSLSASNRNAVFKDTLRTEEIRERQKLNQRGAA
jgi:hypothetical protein